jgi:hypothetical protein
MGIVIPFPTRPAMDSELAIRLWELVLAGDVGSAEYRRLEGEIKRRKAQAPVARKAAGAPASRPWP